MRGQLISDVKFAGGLLGYLQKGGRFDVQQQQVSPGQWELTSLDIHMEGKALLFKSIAVQQTEHRTNFRKVADTLTWAEAADIVRRQVTLAANQQGK